VKGAGDVVPLVPDDDRHRRSSAGSRRSTIQQQWFIDAVTGSVGVAAGVAVARTLIALGFAVACEGSCPGGRRAAAGARPALI